MASIAAHGPGQRASEPSQSPARLPPTPQNVRIRRCSNGYVVAALFDLKFCSCPNWVFLGASLQRLIRSNAYRRSGLLGPRAKICCYPVHHCWFEQRLGHAGLWMQSDIKFYHKLYQHLKLTTFRLVVREPSVGAQAPQPCLSVLGLTTLGRREFFYLPSAG
jgi:hypothetical protein